MNEEGVYTIHPGQHCEHDATRHRWCHAEPTFKPLCQHPTSAAPMHRAHNVEQNDTIHSKLGLLSSLRSVQIKYMFMIKYSDSTVKGFDWNNIGQASQTVAQHYISIGPMYRVIWCFWRLM